MAPDLHRSVWLAYRRSVDADTSRNAHRSFQAAVDIVLHSSPGLDARSACRETARMVMIRPLGIRSRRRPARPAARALLGG
jgi:hypothetical protein